MGRAKNKTLTVTVQPFPLHELERLCQRFGKSRSWVVNEALVQYGAYWRVDTKEPEKAEAKID